MGDVMNTFDGRCRALAAKGARVVPEHQMKALLAECGVPVPKGVLCASREELLRAAKILSYPLVLKLTSDTVLHKTELDGVRTGVRTMLRAASTTRPCDTGPWLGNRSTAPTAR